MKVAESSITMAAASSLVVREEQTETLRAWVDQPQKQGRETQSVQSESLKDKVTLTAQAKDLNETTDTSQVDGEEIAGDRYTLLKLIIEKMTGRKITVFSMKDAQASAPSVEQVPAKQQAVQGNESTPARQGWGVAYDAQSVHSEREQSNFSAKGIIKTADGKDIAFKVDLSMSREFTSSTSVSLRAGDAAMVDPIIIKFAGSAGQVTEATFKFDLNADGVVDNVMKVPDGQGFLALDLNKNGKIDNGTELFGPTTGNGFTELAQYDQDHNNFIDENDPTFNELKIWDGGTSLKGLTESGVGAIYLQAAETPFTLKTDDGTTMGKVVRTGVYVKEDGTVDTVQQVDMSV